MIVRTTKKLPTCRENVMIKLAAALPGVTNRHSAEFVFEPFIANLDAD